MHCFSSENGSWKSYETIQDKGLVFNDSYHKESRYVGKNYLSRCVLSLVQAPFVRRVDSAIHWINHYVLDNSVVLASVYPLDRDLSGG